MKRFSSVDVATELLAVGRCIFIAFVDFYKKVNERVDQYCFSAHFFCKILCLKVGLLIRDKRHRTLVSDHAKTFYIYLHHNFCRVVARRLLRIGKRTLMFLH